IEIETGIAVGELGHSRVFPDGRFRASEGGMLPRSLPDFTNYQNVRSSETIRVFGCASLTRFFTAVRTRAGAVRASSSSRCTSILYLRWAALSRLNASLSLPRR